MDWGQILALMGVNVALIGAMIGIVIWLVNKLDADVKAIGSRLDGHATRIDQLYRMFLDLQKDANQKFYDLLKERK